MPYPLFDRTRLVLKPLDERVHDVHIEQLAQLSDALEPFDHPDMPKLAQAIVTARRNGSAVILMLGAHVIKTGLSRYIIDMMERGWISLVALNGAGMIHDYELATIGATSESVARYIRLGQFGLWRDTGRLNDLAAAAASEGIGLGEAVGRALQTELAPHREVSILAAGYRLHIPVTVHVSLGYDIIHEHPNCSGAALGAASYTDFLVYTQMVTQLEGGVMIAAGTAVMGPEVYLKALSMARNVAYQHGTALNHFTTGVFDLQPLGNDLHHEVPKTDARYYFRPYKTILVRTVQDGGTSYYVQADHSQTIPWLHHLVCSSGDQA
ncbi:MAG: GSU2086 family protein [Anaerolineae bacterium]